MTQRHWLKPSECARRMGHKDAAVILAAIRKGELDARARSGTGTVKRYLVHVDEFERWFDATWKPTKKAS